MVRSPSGDIDILTLFVSHDFGDITIYVDNGTGKSRIIIKVTSSGLSAEEKVALIGLHAFSGNDHVSSFFRKGKSAFWKAMLKRREFLEAFGHLGKELEVTHDLVKALERFVCFLDGFPKNEEVNAVRSLSSGTNLRKRSKWWILASCHHVVIIFSFTSCALTMLVTYSATLTGFAVYVTNILMILQTTDGTNK